MDSKTKAECNITPGWHRIDEEMQTNAEHRNLSNSKSSNVCYTVFCPGLFSTILSLYMSQNDQFIFDQK